MPWRNCAGDCKDPACSDSKMVTVSVAEATAALHRATEQGALAGVQLGAEMATEHLQREKEVAVAAARAGAAASPGAAAAFASPGSSAAASASATSASSVASVASAVSAVSTAALAPPPPPSPPPSAPAESDLSEEEGSDGIEEEGEEGEEGEEEAELGTFGQWQLQQRNAELRSMRLGLVTPTVTAYLTQLFLTPRFATLSPEVRFEQTRCHRVPHDGAPAEARQWRPLPGAAVHQATWGAGRSGWQAACGVEVRVQR